MCICIYVYIYIYTYIYMHMYSKPGHPLCSSAFHYLIHRAYPEVPEHHFRHHLRPSAPCVMLSGLR